MDKKQELSITTGSWIRGVIVLAIAYMLFLVSELILVIITSIVIASAIEPATNWAKRRNIPRLLMILLVYIISGFLFAGLFYFILFPLIGEMSSFIKTLTIYSDSFASGGVISDLFRTQNLFGSFGTPTVIRELSSYLNSLSVFLSQGVFSSISTIFGGILNFLLIVVLSFYLVVQENGVSKFLKIITPLKHEQYVIDLWRRSQAKIGLWIQGQLLVSIMVMMLVYIGLLIMNVPNALLLAVMAGVFDLVPIIGPIVASVPAIFVGFISGGVNMAIIVAIIYLIIQQFEGNIIYPLIHKKMVGVPPMVSITALIAGGILAGFLGILISVPIAAIVMEFISDIEAHKTARMSKIENSS